MLPVLRPVVVAMPPTWKAKAMAFQASATAALAKLQVVAKAKLAGGRAAAKHTAVTAAAKAAKVAAVLAAAPNLFDAAFGSGGAGVVDLDPPPPPRGRGRGSRGRGAGVLMRPAAAPCLAPGYLSHQ